MPRVVGCLRYCLSRAARTQRAWQCEAQLSSDPCCDHVFASCQQVFYLSLSVLHFPAGLESENRLLCSDDAFSVKLTGSLNEFFVAISLK